jgi:hypothetical protein
VQSAEDQMQAGYCLSKTDSLLPRSSQCEFSQPGEMKAGFRQSGESLEFFGSFCFKTKRTREANS